MKKPWKDGSLSTVAQPPRGRNSRLPRELPWLLETDFHWFRCGKSTPFFFIVTGQKPIYNAGMIHGVHLLLNSSNPEADRAFFRDVLHFPHVDVGGHWLIFALPPAEMGIHPADKNLTHPHAGQDLAAATVYLMCDNLRETLDELTAKGLEPSPIQEAEWGLATSLPLPGGARLGLYEPHHALAIKTAASSR